MSELKFEVGDVWETLVDNVAGKPKGSYFTVHSLDGDGDALDGYGSRVAVLSRIARGHVKLISRKGENMNNTFTKDMLVAGKHIVELLNGSMHLVLQDEQGLFLINFNGDKYFSNVDCLQNDLTWRGKLYDDFTVVKVYKIKLSIHFKALNDNIELVWQRQYKSPAQLKLEELEAKQREIADQMEQLRKSL